MTWNHRRTRKEDVSLTKQRVLSAIPAVIATAAFICSYAGNFFCNNVKFVPEGDYSPDDVARPRTVSFGLWKHREFRISNQYEGDVVFSEFCAGYEEGTDFDTEWTLSRAFSCLNIIAAGLLLLWQCFAPFLLFDALYWRWAMVLFAILGGLQTVTLLFLFSIACYDNTMIAEMVNNPDIYPAECSWDWGALVQMASAILYFCTSISFCFIPAPGVRPNERRFPMMVWDAGSHADIDDDAFYCSDDDDDDDDDSVESFACDYSDEHLPATSPTKKQQQAPEDLTETEVSQTGYDDFDDELTIVEVKPDRYTA